MPIGFKIQGFHHGWLYPHHHGEDHGFSDSGLLRQFVTVGVFIMDDPSLDRGLTASKSKVFVKDDPSLFDPGIFDQL